MNLLEFLKLVIGPEFTYVHVLNPSNRLEYAQGFADDLINRSFTLHNHKVLSFYFQGGSLIINCSED